MKQRIAHAMWRLGRSRPPCFISGSPRSGTTWIMEMLETISGARVHWEPINWYLYASGHDRFHGWQARMRPDADLLAGDAAYGAELLRILDGGAPRQAAMTRISRLSAPGNALRLLSARDTIIKFVYAQRALPWMVRNSTAKGCVILRHPVSVVASQIFHPYRPDGVSRQHPEWTREVIEETHPIHTDDDLLRFPGLDHVLRLDLRPEGRLAITACLDLLHALRDEKVRQTYPFAVYEALLDAPERFVEMARALGLPVRFRPTPEDLRRRSRTTSGEAKGGHSGAKRLDADARKQVQEIVEALDLGFYRADGSVDEKRLRSLDIAHLITNAP